MSKGVSVQRKYLKNSGFTIVELMVTVGLVAVLVSIAAPSFSSYIESQRAKNASFELFSSIALARSEALKRNENVTITPTGGSWHNGWTVTAAGGTTIETQNALSGIVISGAPASVVYQKTGRLPTGTSPAPSFQIDISATASSNVRCMRIDLSGMARTSQGACS